MEAGTEGTQQPQLVIANKLFLLTHSDVDDIEKVRLRDEVTAAVVADDMAPLYETLTASLVLKLDQKILDSMRGKIEEDLNKLDEKITDAEENLGQSEVREAHLAKSLFYIRISDKEKALEQLELTEGKTVAVCQRTDLVFYTLQIGFFYMDFDLISRSIDKAKNLVEEGGDWERKNRLKVYEGLYCMSTRNFKKAADLFLDSISNFITYELCSYDTFIFYTVLASIISLDRVSLKQKVVDAPDILAVIGKIPYLSEFLNSLYECQYKSFFTAFAGITEHMKLDRYLYPHLQYYMREIRTVVYSQFLESYKSVTIEAMAKGFGVTADFIDFASSPSSNTSNSPIVSSNPQSQFQNLFPNQENCCQPQTPQTFQQPQPISSYMQPQFQQFVQYQPPPEPPQQQQQPPAGSSRPLKGKKICNKKSWTKEDEVLLATAWVSTSEDQRVGNNQKGDSFWYRVQAFYNKETSSSTRTKDQLTSKWREVKAKVTKFNDIFVELERNRSSGQSEAEILTLAIDSYHQTNHAAFPYMHVWEVLKTHPKWTNLHPVVPHHQHKKSRNAESSSEAIPQINIEDAEDYDPNNNHDNEEPERPAGKSRKIQRSSSVSQPQAGSSSARAFTNEVMQKIERHTTMKEDYLSTKKMFKELQFLSFDVSNLSAIDRELIEKKKDEIRRKYM